MPALRSALADNPFRERLWGQLMLALYRSGRQADALETFQEARRVLADELGLEPGPELRRLQEAILAHDPAIAAVPVDRRRRGNLPAPSTSFVGREDELGEVSRRFCDEHRLVTLTGPPGVGKSRLAVETARSLEREFPDGIWLVEFARAGGAADAVRLLAHAVDVRGSDPLARVASRLRDAGALVVLDACEHVLDEAARIASTLLAECPRCGSWRRAARRFTSPARCDSPSHRSARRLSSSSSSVRGRHGRGSTRTPRPSRSRREIARRVDGLPLAIELAAARVNVLGLAELVSILERRAALLRDGPASDPSRTALQELVEWSYDLLHGDEKTLLQQLAVHRGGASLASLVAVAATHGLNEATVAYLVAALVDKSIVSASFSGGVARYDMLDTVREYVLERLAESGGLAAARGAHAEYFAALAERGARRAARAGMAALGTPPGAGERQPLGCARVRSARRPTLRRESGSGRSGGTSRWRSASPRDGASSSSRFLPRATTHRSSCGSSCSPILCYLAAEELDLDAALAAGERALSLAASAEAPRQLGLAQLTLALALAQSGDGERADAMARAAYATLEAAGDDWGAAASSLIRATGAAHAGDVSTVAAMAAAIRRHSDAIEYDAFRVPGLLLEAWVAERRQDAAAAVEAYRRALELAGRVGFGDHAAFALAGLGVERARERRSARGRGAPAAGACHRRGGPGAVGRGPCTRPARAHRRGVRRRGRCRDGCTARCSSGRRSQRPRQARESLFVALAGSPATAALLGLAELAEARGDTAAADELRGRADLALT